MKTTNPIYLLIVLLFTVTLSFGQTYNDSTTTLDGFQQENSEKSFLSSQNSTQMTSSSEGNSVFIQQVGNNNDVTARISSKRSDIQFVQIGDDNDVYVNLRGNTIQEKILQRGDNNSVLNFSGLNTESLQGEIIQNGNNQNLTWYGGNGISERLKVTMQGEGQSVIVRNF